MTGLEFTSEAAKQLEKVYLTRDVIAQRLETIRQLNLSSGESVLDVGCGPGYLCESMGEIVGRHGDVVGIDPRQIFEAVAEDVGDFEPVGDGRVVHGGRLTEQKAGNSADESVFARQNLSSQNAQNNHLRTLAGK